MFNGYVYKVDCNQSGKCYIGITTTSFDFPSAKVASEATGFCSRSICNCASGKYKYAGKLDGKEITWKYIDSENII